MLTWLCQPLTPCQLLPSRRSEAIWLIANTKFWEVSPGESAEEDREGQVYYGIAWKVGHSYRKSINHIFMGFYSQAKQSAKEMEVWNLQRVIKMFILVPGKAAVLNQLSNLQLVICEILVEAGDGKGPETFSTLQTRLWSQTWVWIPALPIFIYTALICLSEQMSLLVKSM